MKIKRIFYSQKAAPFLFVLPFLLSFTVFWIYPLFSTVKMSFQSILPGQIEWIGLTNYEKLLKDTTFHTAIRNSLTYMFFSIALLIPFPMLFAVLMDSNLVKAKGLWKGAYIYQPDICGDFRNFIPPDVFRTSDGADECLFKFSGKGTYSMAERKRIRHVCAFNPLLLEVDRCKYAVFSVWS